MQITLTAPKALSIKVPVTFELPVSIKSDFLQAHINDAHSQAPVICQKLQHSAKNEYLAVIKFDQPTVTLSFNEADCQIAEADITGIKELPDHQESDAYVHLDTGVFDLELCRGKAEGEGSSKWGLRHFKSKAENKDLLPSGNNAMGGFYGPFFTPDNGLINPAEHLVVDITTLEDGPILKKYRLAGRIPDGLKPELRGKRFALEWSFYYDVPFFSRVYNVDHFETTVNHRSVVDKITVGDEFESGIGQLVFDRFAASSGVWYRTGDPYSNILSKHVDELVHDGKSRGSQFDKFKSLLTGDMASAHWDLYWRLFSVWENALPRDEDEEVLRDIRHHAIVAAELNDRPWLYSKEPVNVSQVPDQTIFAGPATKSAEMNTNSHYTMVWQTANAASAFQIVQRPNSGWQNWGTNAENECPALPVGTLIHTAYGLYEQNWQEVANDLEAVAQIKVDGQE